MAPVANLAFCLLLFWPPFVMGWADHHILTRESLSGAHWLANAKVRVTALEDFIRGAGMSSFQELNRKIKIHKQYRFKLQADERVGELADVLEVLSVYSDEPDWGMDQHLFGEDQYPAIWKPEFKFMGGKEGTPSQAFRHMYWPAFNIFHPVNTFRLPLKNLFNAVGEAHHRAREFRALAEAAARSGHPYWALRFLANSIHYLEDVSSPFHGAQTPSKWFVILPFTSPFGKGRSSYVKQVTHVVSYYHFAFEDYVGKVLNSNNSNLREQWISSLKKNQKTQSEGTLELEVLRLADFSSKNAHRGGRIALDYFPPLEAPLDTVAPKEYMDSAWWKKIEVMDLEPSPSREAYGLLVSEMFYELGGTLRAVIETEWNSLGLRSAITTLAK